MTRTATTWWARAPACIDKVRRWQATGISALMLVPRGPDPVGQMRLFMDEVAAKA